MTLKRMVSFAAMLLVATLCSAGDWGIGVGAAYQNVDDFEDGGAAIVVQGTRSLGFLLKNLAVEAEVTGTLSSPEEELFNSSNVSVGFAEYTGISGGAYAAYSLPLIAGLFVKARVGATVLYAEAESCVVGVCETDDDTTFNVSYGAALGYRLNRWLSIMADWTQIEPDVFHVGVLGKVEL